MEWEVGCAENGRSLRWLAFFDTHISVARSYLHNSLLRMKCQVLDANGTLWEELLKGGSHMGTVGAFCLSTYPNLTLDWSICSKNMSSPSKHEHGIVYSATSIIMATLHHPPVRHPCQSLSAIFCPQYMVTSNKCVQSHSYMNRVMCTVTRLSCAVQLAYPSDTIAVVCPLFPPLSAFRIN